MSFIIRMGLPEMEELWNKLQSEYRVGTISKNDAIIFKKWGKALKLLSENPRHPSLRTHDIEALSERYGERVWQSYLENKISKHKYEFFLWSYSVTTLIDGDCKNQNN